MSLFREDTGKSEFIYIQFSRLGDEEFDFYEYIVDLTESYAEKYTNEALAKNYSESFEVADLAMLERGFYALKPEDLKEIIQNKKEDFELWRDAKKYNL